MGTPDFSSLNREQIINEMADGMYDLLVIGGGITGAGIALDATTRGMKVALVEMQDFAAGTSSRSTKLVHGGLRYLKQFEIKLVAEVGKERAIVYENGPHVTTPEWMLLPIHKGGTFGMFSTSIGLRIYDFLAGVKKSERRKMLSAQETKRREPLIKKEGLKGGGLYVEYRTDDARLTIEVLKEAVRYGAKATNYTRMEQLVYENGQVIGAKVKDLQTNKVIQVHAKKIVNATGPWVDQIRDLDKSKNGKRLRLSKGVHLVIDQGRFPLKQAIYFDTPDGRMMFAIPREGKTYVGTTDTFYERDLVNPQMSESDRTYIINAINYMFPDVEISVEDIESSWAGLRPLIYEQGKDPSEISRKDEIWHSDSGLITIAGGKLTGYRKMAETVVDLVNKELGGNFSKSKTKQLPISGGHVGGSKNYPKYINDKIKESMLYGLTKEQGDRLVRLYGSNIETIFKMSEELESQNKFNLPQDIFLALLYGIKYEMVTKPEDFFIRRTGALFFNIDWVQTWKVSVVECMAFYLKWTDEEKKSHLKMLDYYLDNVINPVE